jgi:rhodanese-related sulfurtransferase
VAVPEIDVESLDAQRANGVALIDVRQPDEYEEAHVPGAVLIPMDEMPERVDDIPMDEPVYIVCQTGARSERVAEWLLRQGYDATNVVGGTSAWMRAGKPVVSGSEAG